MWCVLWLWTLFYTYEKQKLQITITVFSNDKASLETIFLRHFSSSSPVFRPGAGEGTREGEHVLWTKNECAR